MQHNRSSKTQIQNDLLEHNSRLLPIPALTEKQKQRFWAKVNRGNLDECWLWTGGVTKNRYGGGIYGVHVINGQALKPHRIAYTLLVGPIPEGLTLDHLKEAGICTSKLCCNPAHMEPVTGSVNAKRYWDANPVFVCKNGHPREKGKKCQGCNYLNFQKFRERHPEKAREMSRNQKRKERARKLVTA